MFADNHLSTYRRHYISRFKKAVQHSDDLLELIQSRGDETSILEAETYVNWLKATFNMEIEEYVIRELIPEKINRFVNKMPAKLITIAVILKYK